MAPCYGWRSPHTRGARGQALRRLGPRRIIPAYAGSTGPDVVRPGPSRDYPRIRGEHTATPPSGVIVAGSSPHTRGALLSLFFPLTPTRIIPAYAGSTQCAGIRLGERSGSSPHTRGARIHAAARRWPSDHPRIRGEHRQEGRRQGLVWGSSPHTRGARRPGRMPWGFRRDHPRIRGEHVDPLGAFVDLQDHSRIRGEHSGYRRLVSSPMGSSPHTRGAPPQRRRGGLSDGIIPAYAGSTGLRGLRVDGPRGSSPHTRGARPAPGHVPRHGRIIPAYAGSTRRSAPPRWC